MMTIRPMEIEDELLDRHERNELDDLLQGRIDTLNLDVGLLIHDCLELCRQYEGKRLLAEVVKARLLAASDVLDMRQ